jgi:hypothetical protein
MNVEYYKIHKYIKKTILKNNINCDFDETTGEIILKNNNDDNIIVNLTDDIIMTIDYNPETRSLETRYIKNGITILGTSIIEGRPIASGLVIAYIDTHKSELAEKIIDSTIDPLDKTKYLFENDSNGNMKIYDKKTKQELMSVKKAINQLYENKNVESQQTMNSVCKEMFNINDGLNNQDCKKYLYLMLGNSVIGLINLIGAKINSNDIDRILRETNISIKYELLKILGWKFKYKPDGSKELTSYDEWIKYINNKDIESYMKTVRGLNVKKLLEHLVDFINANIDFFSEKMDKNTKTNTITKSNYLSSKNIKRLTTEQIAQLRTKEIKNSETLNIMQYKLRTKDDKLSHLINI